MKKIRILISVDKFTGGAGNVAQQLASLLSKDDCYQVGLMLLNAQDKPKYDLSRVEIIDRKEKDGCHISLPKAVFRYFTSICKLGRMINKWQPDAIVSFLNSISVPLLISQWNTKTPVIVSERSDPYTEWKHNKWSFNLQWWLSYKRADLIVYQYRCFEQFFKASYRKKKTTAIPNMLLERSNRYAIDKNKEKVGFVTLASLYGVKRIDLMIYIFSGIHSKCPNTILEIYGEGPDRMQLEQQVESLGLSESIIFYGNVTDTFSALSHNNIFLLTSEREGFPNALVEAMSVGLPPILFKCHNGLSEIVNSGRNGFLVEKDDVQTFIDYCIRLVEDASLLNEMGAHAKASVQKYSSDNICIQWKNCIKSVLQ